MRTQAVPFFSFKFHSIKLMPMAALNLNPTSLSSSSIRYSNPSPENPLIACGKVFSLRRSTVMVVKCSNSEQEAENGGLNNALSDMVNNQVDELLRKEENMVLLDGLDKASQRVEMAKRALAEIESQEVEARMTREYLTQLEARASEIEESQRDIIEARSKVEEAERSLSYYVDETPDGVTGNGNEEIDKDQERLESVKAASIAALVGTVAGLPISLTQVNSTSQLILPLAISFISCALFGVTFRYSVRRDLDNIQLKTGTSAAFGFVKGLGTLGGGSPLELNIDSILSHAFSGALNVSENVFIFLFASVALDFCFKTRLISPFPMKRPVPKTNS